MAFMTFPSYWECHHPNWRTPSIFQRGSLKPPTSCSFNDNLSISPWMIMYDHVYIYIYILVYNYIHIYTYTYSNINQREKNGKPRETWRLRHGWRERHLGISCDLGPTGGLSRARHVLRLHRVPWTFLTDPRWFTGDFMDFPGDFMVILMGL